MRRALGLDGPAASLPGAARPDSSSKVKSHFASQGSAQTGNVPPRSEPPSPLRQRLAALEHQLTEERAHHDRSRRQLEEARRVLAELQARAQRIALDHADDLTVERTASMRAQRELDDLVFERDRLAPMALPATTPAATRPEPVQPVLQPPASPAVADTPLPAPSGRQRQHTAPEPKPVRWWTASYRAGIKGKR